MGPLLCSGLLLRSGSLDLFGYRYLVPGRVVVRVGLARYAVVRSIILVQHVWVARVASEFRLCLRL